MRQRFVMLFLCGIFVVPVGAQLARYGEAGCENCKPGWYQQRIEDVVPHGKYVLIDDPPCSDPSIMASRASAEVKQASSGDPRADAAAGMMSKVANQLGIGGSVGQLMRSYDAANDRAMCRLVCGIMPEGAVLKAARVYISNKDGGMEHCTLPGQCGGWAHVFQADQQGRSACVVVSNWSDNLNRRVQLDYWYSSPERAPIESR